MIVIIAYTLLVRVGERRWPTELSANSAAMGIIVGVAIGVAMFAVVMAALLSTGTYELTLRGPAAAWHGAGLAIESGVIEEVLIRGVVLRLMWRAFGPLVAFVTSAMLFGLGHIGNPGATVLSTVCVAVEAGVSSAHSMRLPAGFGRRLAFTPAGILPRATFSAPMFQAEISMMR